MKVALYVGNHAADTLVVRAGWAMVRAVQRGEFKAVTHAEAILAEHGDGSVDIGSASLRDDARVRTKERVHLRPGNWRIADVAAWSVQRAREWYAAHGGEPYDRRGALATVLPMHHVGGAWFCNESVGAAAGLQSPHSFGPAQFAAICFSFGLDVSREFFAVRQQGGGDR